MLVSIYLFLNYMSTCRNIEKNTKSQKRRAGWITAVVLATMRRIDLGKYSNGQSAVLWWTSTLLLIATVNSIVDKFMSRTCRVVTNTIRNVLRGKSWKFHVDFSLVTPPYFQFPSLTPSNGSTRWTFTSLSPSCSHRTASLSSDKDD